MRIALFTDTNAFYEDGVGRWLQELIAYVNQRDDHRLLLFYRDGTAEKHEACGPNVTVHNVDSPCVTVPTYSTYPWFYLKSPRKRLHALTEAFEPDLIITVSPYFLFGISRSALGIARKLGVPLWGSFDLHVLLVCRLYGPVLFKLPLLAWAASKAFAWMLRSYRRCSRIFVPSRFIQAHVDQEYGAGKAMIFRRGVDSQTFSPAHRNLSFKRQLGIEDKVTILYVGRLSVEKNLMALLDSYEKLKQKHDHLALVLVGDGPDRHRIEERQVKDLFLTGSLKGDDLSRAYASADIFGFSGLVETGGQAVVEAMASGLPPVVFDQGAAHENVVHRTTGLVAGNDAEFTDLLDELIRDADLRAQLAANARRHAETQTWESILDELLAQTAHDLQPAERPAERELDADPAGAA